jgi:CRISPR-associated endoribonuclease Cas6
MGVSMDLNFVRLIFTLRLEQDIDDRFALFGVKPFFEEAFLQTARCAGISASLCRCPFHQTFSQSLSVDPAALKKYQKPSLPFIFQIPVLPVVPNRGSTVELGLVLTGSALNYLTEYLTAVPMTLRNPRLCRKVSVALEKVESSDYCGTRLQLRQTESGPPSSLLATMSLAGIRESLVLPPGSLSLSIVTPMRLMSEGRPLKVLSFTHFIGALMRRVSSMVYYSGGQELGFDFRWLAEQSRLVSCSSTDLHWEEWSGRWSGFTGRITFAGDLSEFHLFLLAGEYLNLGKGATFGLGRYILERSGPRL